MKISKLVVVMALFCIFALVGCGTDEASRSETFDVDIEIREETFVAQINNIIRNRQEYLDKKIKIEGIYELTRMDDSDTDFPFVFRYINLVFAEDFFAQEDISDLDMPRTGLKIFWEYELPDNGSWVEAVGILEEFDFDFRGYRLTGHRLKLVSLTVLEERGVEIINYYL